MNIIRRILARWFYKKQSYRNPPPLNINCRCQIVWTPTTDSRPRPSHYHYAPEAQQTVDRYAVLVSPSRDEIAVVELMSSEIKRTICRWSVSHPSHFDRAYLAAEHLAWFYNCNDE